MSRLTQPLLIMRFALVLDMIHDHILFLHLGWYCLCMLNIPIWHIQQCTCPISHNSHFETKCTFLLQSGILLARELAQCRFCEIGLFSHQTNSIWIRIYTYDGYHYHLGFELTDNDWQFTIKCSIHCVITLPSHRHTAPMERRNMRIP